MRNIDTVVNGNKLVITIDLSAPAEPSKSGDSLVVATTKGNKVVQGTDWVLGVNCYRPAK